MIRRYRFRHLIARLLHRISLNLKIKAIFHQEGLYLKRYYVGTICNYWRIYLHNFIRDDPDGLHSHPWRWGFSIILCGYYYEERRYGVRKIRWINFVGGNTFHRVLKPHNVECWSLFFSSPRIMNWGFLRDKGLYKQYYEVGQDKPEPLSNWYKTAPTGREWERDNEIYQIKDR